MGNEQEPRPNGTLPHISDETKAALIEDLGLDINQKTKDILQGITHEKPTSYTETMEQIASGIISDVVDVNPKFAEALQEGIMEGYAYSYVEKYRSDIAMGMALVLRAFDIETGYSIIPALKNIQEEDLPKVKETVKKVLGEKENRDLFQRALKAPKIPEMQLNLNQVVSMMGDKLDYSKQRFKDGAATMYRVLTDVYPQLNIPPKNPQ